MAMVCVNCNGKGKRSLLSGEMLKCNFCEGGFVRDNPETATLLVESYSLRNSTDVDRIAELEAQLKTANESNPFLGIKPVLQEYRSGGFVNHVPDMGRISFDMPIIDARVIFNSLKVKRNETT